MSAPQPLTGDELATIKARAEAATPGDWRLSDHNPGEVWADRDEAGFDAFLVATTSTRLNPANIDDAEHIAGMDPATTLRLVAEVERRIPLPEGLDPERAAGALWRLACSPLQWVTGPYPEDWPLDGEEMLGAREVVAVREFQRANGLTVDGILGPQTWVALRARNESHPYDT